MSSRCPAGAKVEAWFRHSVLPRVAIAALAPPPLPPRAPTRGPKGAAEPGSVSSQTSDRRTRLAVICRGPILLDVRSPGIDADAGGLRLAHRCDHDASGLVEDRSTIHQLARAVGAGRLRSGL